MFRLVIHRLPDRLLLRTKTIPKQVFNGHCLAIFQFFVLCSITHANILDLCVREELKKASWGEYFGAAHCCSVYSYAKPLKGRRAIISKEVLD
jgi:hypothetical protein